MRRNVNFFLHFIYLATGQRYNDNHCIATKNTTKKDNDITRRGHNVPKQSQSAVTSPKSCEIVLAEL